MVSSHLKAALWNQITSDKNAFIWFDRVNACLYVEVQADECEVLHFDGNYGLLE